MELPVVRRSWYEPTAEQVKRLDSDWICSYSGGKDSTSLVTWLEWLRRTGWIPKRRKPRLVMSDTGVEFPFLADTSARLMELLESSGWECAVVVPAIKDKLYVQIFGRGTTPIFPGVRKLRWCTRATKIDPMDGFKGGMGLMTLTGVRWGESKTRDAKLLRSGCRAGGECGLPAPGEDRYAAIIDWTDCQVFDWLQGLVAVDVMGDVFDITRRLMVVYKAQKTKEGFDFASEKVSLLRFGCVGCPAISVNSAAFNFHEKEHPNFRHLRRLYGLWDWLRDPSRRAKRIKKGRVIVGPIKMEVRKQAFVKLMEIQERSGVTLVTEEDIAFIKQCWKDKVYPRGWSEKDENFVEERKEWGTG